MCHLLLTAGMTHQRTPEAERPDLQSALGRALHAIALTEHRLLLGDAVIVLQSQRTNLSHWWKEEQHLSNHLGVDIGMRYPAQSKTQPARCSVLLENLLVHSDQAHHTLLRHGFSKLHPVTLTHLDTSRHGQL